MDTIKHTQITEKSIKLSTPGADIETRIVKVSSEIINVADAELRKVEAVAAAQAEAIAGIEEAEQESAESADRAEVQKTVILTSFSTVFWCVYRIVIFLSFLYTVITLLREE